MSDLFKKFFNNSPVSRELTYNGVTETIYIRKLTAGQALQLARGQSVNWSNAGNKAKAGEQTMQVDLGDFEMKRQLRVQFCLCDADAKPVFKGLSQVQELPGDFFNALFKLVEEETADDAGK